MPRLHLQHFAGHEPPGQVWTYPKKQGEPRSAIPEQTGKQTNFYSYRDEDGSINNSVEDVLSLCESEAAPVYKQLLDFEIPDRGTVARSEMATYLALQYGRTPAARRRATDMMGKLIQVTSFAHATRQEVFEQTLSDLERDKGTVLDPEAREALREVLLDPSNLKMEIAQEATLPIVLGLVDSLAPLLHDMNWSVLIPNSGYFVTSDEPVMRRVEQGSIHPFYGDFGFENKTVEVSLALSPQRILVLSWNEHAPPMGIMPSHWVENNNRARIAFADAYVYADRLDPKLKGIVENSPQEGSKMQFSGFGPKEFAPVTMSRKLRD